MDQLRLMRHFEAVFRQLSFSAAASELGLTHSALTKSIRLLEEAWDVQLFHRTTRTVVATEAGKKLYPMAAELLSFAANVRDSIKAGEHILNIVTGPFILESLIHPVIGPFAERYPATRLSASTLPPLGAVEELIQRRIHLLLYHQASLQGVAHFDRLRFRKIIDEPYWLMFRKGHAVKSHADNLEAVVKYDWAIAGFDKQFEKNLPQDVRSLLQRNGFPKYRLLSQAACLDLVRMSDTLTAIPESIAKPLIAAGDLDGMPHPGNFSFSVSAATLHDSGLEPTVEHFIDLLCSNSKQ